MYHLRDTATYLNNKKKLLYLAVFAGAVFLVFIGVSIEQAITNGSEQKARMYQTAIQTKTEKELNYSIDTKQGRVLAPVTIKQVDLVKFPEMNKSYPYVHKEEETYTKHSRQNCTTDSNNNTTCTTEYYYTWDTTDSWLVRANEVKMASRNYPFDLFSLQSTPIDAKDIIDGEKDRYVYVENKGIFGFDIDLWQEADEGDKRYSYDVVNLPQSGTVFLNVTETVRPAFGDKVELYTKNSQELVRDAQNSAQTKSTIFTVFWTILVLLELGGLGYAVYQYQEY